MILSRLSRLLSADDGARLTRYVRWTLAYCAVQGATFALAAPLVGALLEGEIARAAAWLAPLLIGTALTWRLQYAAAQGGFDVALALLDTLRHRIGEHVVTLPLGWFTPDNVGRLGVTLSQGVMDILGLPAHQLTPLMRAVVTPVVLVAALALYDVRMALAATIVTPAVAAVYWWAGRLGRSVDRSAHAAAAEAGERMVEFAQSQLVLRAFGCGERGHAVFDRALVEQNRASRRQLWAVLPPLLANSWVAQLGFLSLMACATSLALQDSDPHRIAALVAVLVLVNRIVEPLTEVAAYSAGIRMASAHIEAVEEILAARPLPEPAVPVAPPTRHDVVFDRVGFGYGPGARVLDGLALTLPAHTTTALVGASGAGKTTILRLIARFWDPDEGSIRIGGVDLRDLGRAELTSLIAPVFQDAYLFAGTLRDNVLLGRPDADEAELCEAAAMAQLDDVIARLPAGWDTPVGEAGALLSGGERQRVTIARALLKRAPILLFDEATGALDAESQAAITEGLRRLRGRATMLVITHQLDTLSRVDRIAVLDGCRIVEQGTHDELIALGGRYASFRNARAASEGWTLRPGNRPAEACRDAVRSG